MSVHEHFAKEAARSPIRPAISASPPTAFQLLEFPPARHHAFDAPAVAVSPSRVHQRAKRFADVCLAAILLVLFAPLLVFIAVVIRLDSAGPCLFYQQRLGLGGKAFRILKFRTMHVQEDGESVRQVVPNDQRVTQAGRFLRASSFDELPQLINVLKGEMSLVGPRPHAAAHDRLYGSLIEDYALRQRVKPGMTGWAQINGLRGATPTLESMRRRVEHDIWYAAHASFFLDLIILLRTPLELVRRRNAY
ncbi:MAG: exopolysaccharide biosynthesis polyprenyl glycosylphosphotransferase [Rhizomicrobium sp.]